MNARKGLAARWGATVVHVGLLWAVAAGVTRIVLARAEGALHEATIVVAEGQSTNTCIVGHGGDSEWTEERVLPFLITELDFRAEYYPHSGVARHYSSLVELRDGANRLVEEINMARPLRYRGYKITQNSFEVNPEVERGLYRVRDLVTSRTVELDASPGLPVTLGIGPGGRALFAASGLGAGQEYAVIDQPTGRSIESGTVVDASRQRHDDASTSGLAGSRDRQVSMIVDAFYPNFRMDESNRPISVGDALANPVVRLSVLRDGSPEGHFFLFHNADLQAMMHQSHPTLEFRFDAHRTRRSDDHGTGTVHEARIKVTDRRTGRELAAVWMAPGTVQEVPGTSEPQAVAPTGIGNGAPQSKRFDVTYLGTVSGHTAQLGVMRDPSAMWVYLGTLIMVAGALLAHVVAYREVWLWLDTERGQLHLASVARMTRTRSHREFRDLVAALEALSREPHSPEESRKARR